MRPELSIEAWFEGRDPRSRPLYEAVRAAVAAVGPAQIRVTRSQIAFRRRLGFAWVWEAWEAASPREAG